MVGNALVAIYTHLIVQFCSNVLLNCFNGQVVPVNGSKLTPLLGGLGKSIGKFGARQEKVASSVLCDSLLIMPLAFCYGVNLYS